MYNKFITEEISLNDLYVSGHWTAVIRDWVLFQRNLINDKTKFAQNFEQISNRIKNPKQYTDFVGKLTYYLTQFGGNDDFVEAIAHTVLNSGKVTEYLGSMQVYLKSMIGMQAPDLVIPKHLGKPEEHNHKTSILKSSEFAEGIADKTLLVFYESGCGPCQELLQQLLGIYENLKKNGIILLIRKHLFALLCELCRYFLFFK